MRPHVLCLLASVLLIAPSLYAADLPAANEGKKPITAFPRDENGKPPSSFTHEGKPISAFSNHGKPITAFPRDENGKPPSSFVRDIKTPTSGTIEIKQLSIAKNLFCAHYPAAASCKGGSASTGTSVGTAPAYAPPPPVESSDKH